MNLNVDSYFLMVHIFWMLENNLILGDILRYLNDMVIKTGSFKNKFFYYYTKRTIQSKLKDYYYHRNLFLNNQNENEKSVI